MNISHPETLYFLIPLGILLFLVLRKKYVQDDLRLFKSKGRKRFIFFSRMLFFTLLLLALSSPYTEYTESNNNISRIKVLYDKSTSMQLFDLNEINYKLEQAEFPVEIKELDMGNYSSIGNSILNHLAPNENILIITDGQNNFGTDLSDMVLFASSINSRIFGLNLQEKEYDASIIIEGPSKVVTDVENSFKIKINEIGNERSLKVKIYLDNILIYDDKYKNEIEIKRSFSSGSHVFKAVIDREDYFLDNNIYYKAVTVHSRPKILFVSETNSPLFKLIKDFYSVKLSDDLDNAMDYHAIILNNLEDLDDDIDIIEEYLQEENGLLVIGGKNSYDWGDYNKSLITEYLPVSVGKATKKKDVISIMILMDTGASSGEIIRDDIKYIDVQKTLAVDIINSINPSNKVGFIEGNYYINTLTGLSELQPKKEELIEEIKLLSHHGFSELRFAYEKAYQALKLTKGSKNIIIITDGKLIPQDQAMTLEIVKAARSEGIKTYIIGVGESAEQEFLQKVKEYGDGEYFRTDESHRLQLYFGDPEPSDDLNLFVYDSNHFITQNIQELGEVYGYNTVYPKTNARLLITTASGDPILTTWQYGLGRVAALTTDDGTSWNSEMLDGSNSKAIIRTLNWLVEDPERKNTFKIDFPELRVRENAVITVESNRFPEDKIVFYESDKGIYKGNYYPEETGITEILDTKAAVNYQKELLNLGVNKNLEKTLAISGGKMIDDINDEQISLTTVETTKTKDLSWIFILGAIIIYLFEIVIRRIYTLRRRI